MPHSWGYRARTRDLFSKKPNERGRRPIKAYLQTYKLGDFVDVIADSSEQKGMPHKYYHGKTGRVWNISRRAIGVVITKVIGNRQMLKKIHVRVEHVRPSRCREAFLKQVKENRTKLAEAKKAGKKVSLKRSPAGPRDGFIVKVKNAESDIVDISALPYRHQFE
eukprot:274400_1